MIAAVAAAHRVSVRAVLGRNGCRFARAEGMYLLRRLGWSYERIGRYFGRRKSTVWAVVQRYERLVGRAAPCVFDLVDGWQSGRL